MITISKLVQVTTDVLAQILPSYAPDMNIRTVRYYDSAGLLHKPKRVGRDNMYSAEHLKQLVALKILQSEGCSLAQIKLAIKSRGLEDILESHGVSPHEVEKIMRLSSIVPDEVKPSAHPERKEREMPVKKKSESFTGNEKNIKVEHDGTAIAEYHVLRDKLKLGSVFAFISGADGELAKSLHRVINGVKAGPGELNEAILPVFGNLPLPGCELKASAYANASFCVLVADKDVYKEGDDVARVFVFDPASANKEVMAVVTLDGAKLDNFKVKLDENGCALARVATLVSGTYVVSIEGKTATCTFEATRYELAPLTVTATKITKDSKNINVELLAETYGAAFDGAATVTVTEGLSDICHREVTFKNGRGEVAVSLDLGEGPLSLRVQATEDAKLVAGVPIQGSSKAERSDTTLSEMGKVSSMSLMGKNGLFKSRGMYFDEGEKTNTPIELMSCVDQHVVLTVRQDAKSVVVALRNPETGETKQISEENVKAGFVIKTETGWAITAVHVGAIFDGEPWEGHAIVVRPTASKVQVTAPAKSEPGKVIKVKIAAPEGSSVLVKIVDKRVRAMYEPMVAVASVVKGWMIQHMLNRLTGFKLADAPSPIVVRPQAFLRGARGGYGGGGGGRGMVFGASMLSARSSYDDDAGGPEMYYNNSRGIELCSFAGASNLVDDTQQKQISMNLPEMGYIGNASVFSKTTLCESVGLTYDQEVDRIRSESKAEKKARETQADLIYCDLVKVDGEKTLAIKLPDSTGLVDVKAFAVKGVEWAETSADIVIEKETYLEPLIPHMAHPEDEIKARCVAVRAPEGAMFSVRVDGEKVEFKETRKGANVHLSWNAVPGVHEVTLVSNEHSDKVIRVVEAPGEEIVLTQELRILKNGETFDLDSDEALSVAVLPGMESELTVAVNVCTEFGHSCCEQSAAMITAACVSYMVGDDSSKNKASQTIIKGEARMRSMWKKGEGFKTYPDYDSITPDWSLSAARRLASLGMVTESIGLPDDVRKAIDGMIEMGKDVLKTSNKRNGAGEMETCFYEGKPIVNAASKVAALRKGLDEGFGSYSIKAEAAFCAACLLRDNKLDDGIELANAVAQSMGGTMGGGMHGSYESLAYMHMVDALRKAGVVPGAGKASVKVDGKKMKVEEALGRNDISSVEAVGSAIALRVNRIQRIKFDEVKSGVQMSIDLKSEDGTRDIKPGKPVTLTVKLKETYQEGDVACVVLPDCLSRVVGGAMAKKFQVDFRGKTEIQVKLVAHEATDKPQRWSAVVRNMYDGARIGSVGLIATAIAK